MELGKKFNVTGTCIPERHYNEEEFSSRILDIFARELEMISEEYSN